jgi:hypothetical protein
MTTQKQILNSHSPAADRDSGPYSAHYVVNDGYRGWILLLIILLPLAGVALVFAQNAAGQTQARRRQQRDTTSPTLLHSAERVAEETALMTRAGWQDIPDSRTGTGTRRCGETVPSSIWARSEDQTAV